MLKKLVINDTVMETRVAFLEDGNLVELFIDRKDEVDIAGNIYKGRVQRVLPGMQAAFVDIGMDHAAFIHANDIYVAPPIDELDEIDEEDHDSDDTDEIELERADEAETERRLPIEELIREGQEIMVHVSKSPIGTKGARVTTHISLPGRLLVLMPTSNHVGISRRIIDKEERHRLREMVYENRSKPYGYIVRTAAEGIGAEKLQEEMLFLNNLWETIQEKYKSAPVPSLIHEELNSSLRAVRDLLTHDADKLIIDSKRGYDAILSFLDRFMPNLSPSVELYEGKEPLFDAYRLEGDISRALKRKVWLKSGGYIVIEQTEALVAIDVNTGRYVGKHNLEETILETNLEAVKEIAYQVRLRDIGGIIIIDFIDMEKKSNQEKVFNALLDALKKDKSKTHVLPISEIGLIQMTRKRVRSSLTSQLCEACFYCDGEGYLMSRKTVCHNIYREILRQACDLGSGTLGVRVNTEIAELLHVDMNYLMSNLEQKLNRRVVIYPNTDYHLEAFDVFEVSI